MRGIILLLAVLLCAVGSSTLAQDSDNSCSSWQADCSLKGESAAVMAELESAAFHLDFNFAAKDRSSYGNNQVSFRIIGDGTFTISRDQIALFNDPAPTLQNNPDRLPELVEQAIRAVSADMTVIVQLPPELVDDLNYGSSSDIPERFTFDIRLVDGFGYINMDKIAALDTTGYTEGGWKGIDIAGLMGMFLEETPESWEGFSAIGESEDMLSLGMDFMRQRLPDIEIDGQTMGIFQVVLDMEEILDSPLNRMAFAEGLYLGLAGQIPDTPDARDKLVTLFESLEMAVTETIGADDKYLHRFEFALDWSPDMNLYYDLMGEPTTPGTATVDMHIDLQVDMSQFNDAPPVSEPPDAIITPLSWLMPYIMPMSSGRA